MSNADVSDLGNEMNIFSPKRQLIRPAVITVASSRAVGTPVFDTNDVDPNNGCCGGNNPSTAQSYTVGMTTGLRRAEGWAVRPLEVLRRTRKAR